MSQAAGAGLCGLLTDLFGTVPAYLAPMPVIVALGVWFSAVSARGQDEK